MFRLRADKAYHWDADLEINDNAIKCDSKKWYVIVIVNTWPLYVASWTVCATQNQKWIVVIFLTSCGKIKKQFFSFSDTCYVFVYSVYTIIYVCVKLKIQNGRWIDGKTLILKKSTITGEKLMIWNFNCTSSNFTFYCRYSYVGTLWHFNNALFSSFYSLQQFQLYYYPIKSVIIKCGSNLGL